MNTLQLLNPNKLVGDNTTVYPEPCQLSPHPAAQQEAQRAQFVVERAKQERQEKVVRAEGEAEAATMISLADNSNVLVITL